MSTQKSIILLTAVLTMVLTSFGYSQGLVGVALEYDSTTVFTVEAGETIHFELVARNADLDVVEDWDQIGRDMYLTVTGSHAETDSSTRSWSAFQQGFSWLDLRLNDTTLSMDSSNIDSVYIPARDVQYYYTLPKSAFTRGRAALTFSTSRAENDIVLSVTPWWTLIEQESPPITVTPGPIDNYLLDLTTVTQGPDKVFLLRRYELVVGPRDRYLNVVSDTTIRTRFTARFPDEFDQNAPGLSDIFSGEAFIKGVTNYFLASRVRRIDEEGEERQWILAYGSDDSLINGRCDPYQILDHAPNPFRLESPPDNQEIRLLFSSDEERFTWSRAVPPDPYTDIRLTRFDPSTHSDEVHYTIRFSDSEDSTRSIVFESDNSGKDTSLTLTYKQLSDIIEQFSGSPTAKHQDVVWYVEATDGLYVTESTPPNNDPQGRPGFRLRISRDMGDAVSTLASPNFTLHQNYPNPFNPSTEIPVALAVSTYCRLRVCNLMGEEVALLHSGFLEAGTHCFTFEGSGMPSGVYTCRLDANGATLVRSMLLLR